MTSSIEHLGQGAYTLAEASRYSRISPNKLSRWIFGTSSDKPVIDAAFLQERIIAFHDLIQCMAVSHAQDQGVPIKAIRESVKRVKERDMSIPLARNHKLIWFDPNLYIEYPGKELSQVSGFPKGQTAMKIIAEEFKKDLKFDEEGIVTLFTPYTSRGREITLDPQRQFGQPLVGGTGYRADVLFDAYVAEEESVDNVATGFGLATDDVMAAVEYFREHLKIAA